MIFSPDQKRRLRELRVVLKLYGQLERDQPDLKHWLAASGAAREALTIIQTAVGIDNTVSTEDAQTLAAKSITDGIEAEIETWDEIIEVDAPTLTAAEYAIKEIFDELYGQLVAQVEGLEAVANLITQRDQVTAQLEALSNPDDDPSINSGFANIEIEALETGMHLHNMGEAWLDRPRYDEGDGIRVCEVCGDYECVAPATKCHRCLQQEWIDKYG